MELLIRLLLEMPDIETLDDNTMTITSTGDNYRIVMSDDSVLQARALGYIINDDNVIILSDVHQILTLISRIASCKRDVERLTA